MAEGYSVAIKRKDGSEFLAASMHGILPPVWLLSHRHLAVQHKRELIEHGFKARVVRVTFERPAVAATRRAIVRAAASLGSARQEG